MKMERIINGVLSKFDPDLQAWVQLSAQELTRRLIQIREFVAETVPTGNPGETKPTPPSPPPAPIYSKDWDDLIKKTLPPVDEKPVYPKDTGYPYPPYNPLVPWYNPGDIQYPGIPNITLGSGRIEPQGTQGFPTSEGF